MELRAKSALRTAWREQRSQALNGIMSTESWLTVVRCAIEKVFLEGSWRRLCLADGLLHRQQDHSPQLLLSLGPTTAEASCVFQSRLKVDILSYLLWQTKTQPKEKEAMKIAPLEAFSSSRRRPFLPTFAMTCAACNIRTLDRFQDSNPNGLDKDASAMTEG